MKKDARSGRREWNGTMIKRMMGLDEKDMEEMMTNLKGRDMAQQQEGKKRQQGRRREERP